MFDSGVGGLGALSDLHHALPARDLVFLADHAAAPYGPLTANAVIERCRIAVERLAAEGVELVVVACNTATVAAIGTLREDFPELRFVGYEPGVRPAAAMSQKGVIGVLGTVGSLRAPRFRELCATYAGDVEVVAIAAPELVQLVEDGEFSGPRAERLVAEHVGPMTSAGVDVIVLGCTHFRFLSTLIGRAAGPEVALFDPTAAVVARVKALLGASAVSRRGDVALRDTDPSRLPALRSRWNALQQHVSL